MAEQTPQKPEKKRSENADLWRYAAMGSQLAVTVAIFVGIGWWLDSKYGWSPWGLIGFGVLGVLAGLYHFLKDALK